MESLKRILLANVKFIAHNAVLRCMYGSNPRTIDDETWKNLFHVIYGNDVNF